MNVTELFRRLSYGEFSNIALGTDGGGDILEDKKPKIITYTNDALLALYSRFILREEEMLIEEDEGIRYYELISRYSLTAGDPDSDDILFIKDLPEDPFKDDVIKILAVTAQDGIPLILNDPESEISVFTPQPNVLQVPNPITGDALGIIYQARHPLLDPEGDYDEMQIVIPISLEKALTSYIAYLAYSHMNGQESTVKAAEHMNMYEDICSRVENMDLVSSSYSFTNTRFVRGGWV